MNRKTSIQTDAHKSTVQKKEKSEDRKIEDPKDKKIEELTNDLKRVQADFSNYCKKIEKDKQEFIQYASASFICKTLPIIDELEIALQSMKHEEDKKGMHMILNKIKKLLDEEGVKEIKSKGEQFDPYKHEAILFGESDKDGTVMEELQKGYELKGKVLRYSKVKVSKGLSKEPAQDKTVPGIKTHLEGEQK